MLIASTYKVLGRVLLVPNEALDLIDDESAGRQRVDERQSDEARWISVEQSR